MKPILPKEILKYKAAKKPPKDSCDKSNQIITKLKIVKRVLIDKYSRVEVADSFNCHRNTVANILTKFSEIDEGKKQQLLYDSLPLEQLLELASCLSDTPSIPKSHPRMVSKGVEQYVVGLWREDGIRVGVKRLRSTLDNTLKNSPLGYLFLENITTGQLKGIYKRNGLKCQKVRTKNGQVRHLYDYGKLSAFQYLHFDTKDIVDAHALPPKIYQYFACHKKKLPTIEWNIVDAKTRTRFVAYSFEKTSEFGLRFLLLVLSYIRSFSHYYGSITVWMDNGVEFACGSSEKLAQICSIISPLNATAKAYHPYFDVRKNLIERTHRSDDEEFLVPKGELLKDHQSFLTEAKKYHYYWNNLRSHSGIGMNNQTPKQKLRSTGLSNVEMLTNFPTFIIEHNLPLLREVSEPFLALAELKRKSSLTSPPRLIDQKVLLDTIDCFNFLSVNAQKVLTYYQF
jgi:hypothetical protein